MNFVLDNILFIIAALVSGGLLVWQTIGPRLQGGTAVNAVQATRLINDDNALVLDVRANSEFMAGHLAGARNIPLEDVAKRLQDVPKGRRLILCCASGTRAGKAARTLREAGHEGVVTLEGGIAAWTQAGLPLVR